MSSNDIRKGKTSEDQSERLKEAQKSFKQMKKELAPFIRERKVSKPNTRGKWCDSSCYEFHTRE